MRSQWTSVTVLVQAITAFGGDDTLTQPSDGSGEETALAMKVVVSENGIAG